MTSRRNFLAFTASAVVAGAAPPVPAQATPITHPDAELMRLADAIEANTAESDRLGKLEDAAEDPAEARRLWNLADVLVWESWDLRKALAMLPATTLEGFRAKARIVRLFDYAGDGYASPGADEAMACSLANDLLGMPTGWQDSDPDYQPLSYEHRAGTV